ncbi:unnamed protein product [Owenia fusiformis]|uniref:Uncharacterized protein n=1 Tax=Owenia fusiformis TaxID=6347 RepID=A0A8J1U273_OWEFU|nr:unnamed protein product [Owenia fusiformis]
MFQSRLSLVFLVVIIGHLSVRVESQQACICPDCIELPGGFNCEAIPNTDNCNCATCGCIQGTLIDWCSSRNDINTRLVAFLFYHNTDFAGTSFQVQEFEGVMGMLLNYYPSELGDTLCTQADILALSCEQRQMRFSQTFEVISFLEDEDVPGLKNFIVTLESLQTKTSADFALLDRMRDSLGVLELTRRFLYFYNPKFSEGKECLANGQCPTSAPHCVDCSCHQCRDGNDCREPGKLTCRSNRAGMMVCGDPHIKQTIKGTNQKLCYDILGAAGRSYLLLDDNGIKIVSKFITGENSSNSEGWAEYVSDLSITVDGVHIKFNTKFISVTEPGKPTLMHNWLISTIYTSAGWMAASKKQVNVYIRDGETTVNVIRKGLSREVPFLNFGSSELHELSANAGGILGSIANNAKLVKDGAKDLVHWNRAMIPVKNDSKVCLHVDPFYQAKLNSLLERFIVKEEKLERQKRQ